MENDYVILEKAQNLIDQYVQNPNNCNKKEVWTAFCDLGELLLRSEHQEIHKDILERGYRAYFKFIFESDAFTEDYKQELIARGQAQLKSMPGWTEAAQNIH